MYTKEEASKVRQKFWTSFGKYMQPIPSSIGEKINWVNYKTGIKGISFKMDVDNIAANVSIEFFSTDKALQKKYFDCFLGLKKHFIKSVGKGWEFHENYLTTDYKNLSIAFIQITNVKVFRESDWPTIISFFKKNIIALDAFWNNWKPAFDEML